MWGSKWGESGGKQPVVKLRTTVDVRKKCDTLAVSWGLLVRGNANISKRPHLQVDAYSQSDRASGVTHAVNLVASVRMP